MATMTVARCPKCQIEVGSTWRWCLACGYDPDGSAQRVRQAAIEARQREGGWIPVLVVLVGLVVGGIVLWRTTPDDTSLPTESASTAAEVDRWVPFTPPSGGFRVDLPAAPVAPDEQTQTLSSGRVVESYAVGAGDHLFTVAVVDTSKPALAAGDQAAREAALRGYVEELAAAVSGEIARTDVAAADAVPTLDYRIEGSQVGDVRGRVIIVGTRLVGVSVSSVSLSDDIATHVTESLLPV